MPSAAAALVLYILAVIGVVACQPDSVTGARDQLARGEPRVTEYLLPVARDSFSILDFVSEEDTTLVDEELLGLRISPGELVAGTGDEIDFDDVSFDLFTFSYDQMLETRPVGESLVFDAPPAGTVTARTDPVRLSTPEGSRVVEGEVAAGTAGRVIENTTDCPVDIDHAVEDATGAVVTEFPAVTVAPGGTEEDAVDLAGAAFEEHLVAVVQADFGACLPSAGGVTVDFELSALVLASVTLEDVDEPFTSTYRPLDAEPRFETVDTVGIRQGTLALEVDNRLPVAMPVEIVLGGFERDGQPLRREVTVSPAPGDGTTTVSPVEVGLDGVTVVPGEAEAQVSGRATADRATFSPTVTTDAVTVRGDAAFDIVLVAGPLDPAITPELSVTVEEVEELRPGDVSLGDLEDAVRDATLNRAVLELDFRNTAEAPILVSDFVVGAVRLDDDGEPLRDAGGGLDFERDASGEPILVPVAKPDGSPLEIPRAGNSGVDLEAAPLVDRLVDLVLDERRVGVAGTGTVSLGDGLPSRVVREDEVSVRYEPVVGFDLTLPEEGVSLDRNQGVDGLGLSDPDADQVGDRLADATAILEVENETPLGVDVSIAMVPGLRLDDDIFDEPDRVELETVSVAAAAVDGGGRVTEARSATVRISLTGEEARVLFGEEFTSGLRIRLRPAEGGRSAILAGDEVRVDARIRLLIRSGGGEGTE